MGHALVPAGWEWKDVSYVIGGARWKTRFVDQDGYVVTKTGPGKDQPGKSQYNLATGRWIDYHPGERKPTTAAPATRRAT